MFRFTIRELLLLTLVAGFAVGWWVERTRANKLQEREKAALYVLARYGYEHGGYEPGPTHLKLKRESQP